MAVGRPAAQKPNDWHRRLLRESRERPCGRSTEECDEVAPLHAPCPCEMETHGYHKPCCASPQSRPANDRLGSIASFWALVPDVGYYPDSDPKRRFALPSG